MLQCQDCEFFDRSAGGSAHLACDPYATVKEPECIAKWQLAQLSVIAKAHQATLDMYRAFAPLQEKMLRHVEREIDAVDDADSWKQVDDEDEDDKPFRA